MATTTASPGFDKPSRTIAACCRRPLFPVRSSRSAIPPYGRPPRPDQSGCLMNPCQGAGAMVAFSLCSSMLLTLSMRRSPRRPGSSPCCCPCPPWAAERQCGETGRNPLPELPERYGVSTSRLMPASTKHQRAPRSESKTGTSLPPARRTRPRGQPQRLDGRGTYRVKPRVKPLGIAERSGISGTPPDWISTTSPRRPMWRGRSSLVVPGALPTAAASPPGQQAVNKAASTHVVGPARRTPSGLPSSMRAVSSWCRSTPSPAPTRWEARHPPALRSPAAAANLPPARPATSPQQPRPKPHASIAARNHRRRPSHCRPPPPQHHSRSNQQPPLAPP